MTRWARAPSIPTRNADRQLLRGAAAFCDILRNAEDIDIEEDPEAAAEAFRRLRDTAPSDLKDDVRVLADLNTQLSETDETDLAEGGGFGAMEEAFGERVQLMLSPEVVAAEEALSAYSADECGIDPGLDDPTGAVETFDEVDSAIG